MFCKAVKVVFRPDVFGPLLRQFVRKYNFHTKLPYRNLPVMGVTVSSSREKKVFLSRKSVPQPSFASFSTTGTLTTDTGEGTSVESSTMIEVNVGQYDDCLQDGTMRTIDIGEGKALLVRENGEYSAVGHKCTHYGAPLSTGHLSNGRVRCPWHGACFNVKTGDIEDFPGLDSLPKFEVVIKNDNVIIRAHPEQFTSHKRVKTMVKEDTSCDKRVFVIIGGGGAAMKAAETLREEGFRGRVIMITKEAHLPYDRPILSKKLAATADSLKLRSMEFLKDHDIELMTKTEATALDNNQKTVTLSNGTVLNYDSVLIATGGKPRSLSIPGSDLENIFLLRSPEDANQIASFVPGKNVVIIGTSFIGMELASNFADKAASVTCVGRSSIPFANVLGEKIGAMLKKTHESKGVKFITDAAASSFKGDRGKLTAVCFNNGTEVPADICIQGVGVSPSTDFLKKSSVPQTSRGDVIVDKYMKACEGVFAAGDIAHFPLKMLDWEKVTIGHWQISHKHGLTAARNMLGGNEEIDTIPFFWTSQYGKSIRYCGHAHSFDDVLIDGSVDEQKFTAYFAKGDKILAVATMGPGNAAAKAADEMFEGKMRSASEIRAGL
ncbi:apoptosis-inducing factor 3-like [Pocillopora damicornis]|uniref:apoptosis-inducing factor 3-like n=1 Tax=Pocillopora damicornis TaxID=46731 RepID=UPI000F551D8C|nr:apoptosis-inducing factor 3-like [Pocillopora damicornis]